MRFSIQRETLLKPLQSVVSIVERRQTLPMLGNILLEVTENELSLTSTDLELELVIRVPLIMAEPGKTTVPAHKFLDICRVLPESSELLITQDGERVLLKSNKLRYTLTTLPAIEFPKVAKLYEGTNLSIPQDLLKKLIAHTHFAMAVADERYFLLGLMLEVEKDRLHACGSDGHRLALSEMDTELELNNNIQVIVPRKGVGELLKLLQDSPTPVKITIGSNHIQIVFQDMTFTSKLIDGKFPDYKRIIPHFSTKIVTVVREELRQALSRTTIISKEKFREVRLNISSSKILLVAANPEQEQAEDELTAEYQGEDIEIGFNAGYLLDVLNAIDTERVVINLTTPDSSALIHSEGDLTSRYVVMPMRL